MVKYASWWLIIILIIAFLLRFYKIADNPPAVYGDEISFAWNAWSILKTGADEFGIRFPLQFKAFDDYKAPIPVYLLVPFFYFLGMTAFSVRLPIVLAGTATVWATYHLTRQIVSTFDREKLAEKQKEICALISAALLAISPWHIHLSRGYFEATLALLPFIGGMYWFLKGLQEKKYFLFSSFAFAASIYTYFTPRLVIPLFLLFLLWYTRQKWWNVRKNVFTALVVLVIVLLPLVKLAFFDKGANRMQYFLGSRLEVAKDEATKEQITAGGPLILKKIIHSRYVVLAKNIGTDYLEHFSLHYWYLYGDNSLRYFLGKMGMFHLLELPFLLIGFYALLRKQPRILGFLIGWLLIVPIPTAIVGRSFAVRSLAMLPAPFIIVSFGLFEAWQFVKNYRPKWSRFLVGTVAALFGISIGLYIWRYQLDYPRYAATWWGWENKAALEYAKDREDQYDQIIFSDFYTGMPLALGFYSQSDPTIWRDARDNRVILEADKQFMKVGKYYIGSFDLSNTRLAEEVLPPRTLYIGRPEEPDGIATILAPDDGRILFKIHERL